MSAATASPSATAWAHPRPPERRPGVLLLGAGLLLWLTAAAAPSLAQPSEWVQATVVEDSAATANSPVTPTHTAPRQALIRSAVLPGWGQVTNGHRLKGMLFGVATAGLAGYTLAGQRDLDRISGQLDDLRRQDGFSPRIADLEAEAQNLAGARNTRILYLALSITAAALDAYVDAHLADFRDVTELAVAPLSVSGPGLALSCVRRF